jgi:phosphoglycerate dehydrogenase-like enzyme
LLRLRAIAGAGLDVYDEEPLPGGHPLRAAPRTALTPHLGYVTDDGYRTFHGDAVEDIAAFTAGRLFLTSPGSVVFLTEQTSGREPVHGSNQAS